MRILGELIINFSLVITIVTRFYGLPLPNQVKTGIETIIKLNLTTDLLVFLDLL